MKNLATNTQELLHSITQAANDIILAQEKKSRLIDELTEAGTSPDGLNNAEVRANARLFESAKQLIEAMHAYEEYQWSRAPFFVRWLLYFKDHPMAVTSSTATVVSRIKKHIRAVMILWVTLMVGNIFGLFTVAQGMSKLEMVGISAILACLFWFMNNLIVGYIIKLVSSLNPQNPNKEVVGFGALAAVISLFGTIIPLNCAYLWIQLQLIHYVVPVTWLNPIMTTETFGLGLYWVYSALALIPFWTAYFSNDDDWAVKTKTN